MVFLIKRACHVGVISIIYTAIGDVAKLVDALDLGSSAARCESSSLSVPTNEILLLLMSNVRSRKQRIGVMVA